MNRTPIGSENTPVEGHVCKERLRQLACKLDAELIAGAQQSQLLGELSRFPPLLDAIRRSKEMVIEQAEEVQGISYWYLHTDLQAVIQLVPSLSEFLFVLERWKPEQDDLTHLS